MMSPEAVNAAPTSLSALPAVAVTLAAVGGMIGLGFEMRRRRWIGDGSDATLLALLVRVFIPSLIVTRVLGNEALRDWRNVVYPPAIAFGLTAAGMAIGWLAWRLLRRDPSGRRVDGSAVSGRTFAVTSGIFNYGFLMIPLTEALYPASRGGGGTTGVLFVFNLGVEAAMWGLGVTVLAGSLARGWWKRLLGPPVVATLAALAVNVADVQLDLAANLPDGVVGGLGAIGQMMAWLGGAAIPLGLLLTGSTICDDWYRCRLRSGVGTVATAALVRLAAMPAVFVAIAMLLPITTELRRVILLQAAMPAGVFPIVLARHFGGDVGTALRVVVGTSLLSLVTMPIWVTLGLWLLR